MGKMRKQGKLEVVRGVRAARSRFQRKNAVFHSLAVGIEIPRLRSGRRKASY